MIALLPHLKFRQIFSTGGFDPIQKSLCKGYDIIKPTLSVDLLGLLPVPHPEKGLSIGVSNHLTCKRALLKNKQGKYLKHLKSAYRVEEYGNGHTLLSYLFLQMHSYHNVMFQPTPIRVTAVT